MTHLELAEAMIKGLQSPDVEESIIYYVETAANPPFCMACALGVALIGKYGGDFRLAEVTYHTLRHSDDETDSAYIFADLLDISPFLAEKVEGMHLRAVPIKEIVSWLKERAGATD